MKSIFLSLCIVVLYIHVRPSFLLADDSCVNTLSKDDPLVVSWRPKGSDRERTLTLKKCRRVTRPKFNNALCLLKEVKEQCCATCAKLDACKDSASDANPLEIYWESPVYGFDEKVTITRCQQLKKKYTIFCKKEAKQKCCATCRKLTGLKCIDDFRTPGEAVKNHENFTDCKTYVKQDPCRCHAPDTKQHCCESCKNIDTAALDCDCTDKFNPILRPGYAIEAKVEYMVNSKAHKLFYDFLSDCAMLRDYFPAYCDQQFHEKVSSMCCKSCKGVDYSCVDNTFFTFNVNHGSISCQNCTCHDIRKESKQLMKRACQQNLDSLNGDVTVRNACCHQCKRLGFNVPEDYTADNNLAFFGDVNFVPNEGAKAANGNKSQKDGNTDNAKMDDTGVAGDFVIP